MEKLIGIYFDSGVRIHFKSKTKVTLENRVYEPLAFYEFSLKTYPFFKEFVLEKEVWQWNDKDKSQWILKFWEGYFAEMRLRMANASDVFDGSSVNTSDFELVSDFHSGEKIVYNSKQRFISKMHPNTFLSAMGKSQRQILTECGVRVATFNFNPYNDFERRVVTLEGQEVVEFNCFHAPMWRCDEKGKLDLSLEKTYENQDAPMEFVEFMRHLVPKEEQRHYVYHWMSQAIFNRNETYLCLNGKKGAGKNFFVELMSHLVGRDYFKDMNQRVFDEGFNAVLDKARLIQLDEIKVETDHHANRLKKYINRDQNIEFKGIDANKLSETFNSFIINNNDITDMRLKWDDRRFSVPDLTVRRLEDIWPKERIDKLYANLTDLDFQRQVGFYVKKAGASYPNASAFSVLKGERFWRIVYNSLSEWERVILDVAIARQHDSIELSDIKTIYRRRVDGAGKMFPLRIQKIRDFLEEYKHNGQDLIGTITGHGEEATVTFFPHFQPIVAESDKLFNFKPAAPVIIEDPKLHEPERGFTSCL